jgi:thiol:disulfide interchange protein DsbA
LLAPKENRMIKLRRSALCLGMLLLSFSSTHAATQWVEGTNYFAVPAPKASTLPRGQVEVTEVFSYGCPACNAFLPTMHKLEKSLPPNAVVDYIAASFIPAEDWPMFQTAYYTAKALGVAAKVHDKMFDAVWVTGQLATFDPTTHRLKDPLPSIADAARFYHETTGVPLQTFLDTAKSFDVYTQTHNADQLIFDYRADSTPTIVVAGKYRLTTQSAGGADQLIALVDWLVAQESKTLTSQAHRDR